MWWEREIWKRMLSRKQLKVLIAAASRSEREEFEVRYS